jgi:hypothetical protein
VTHNSPRYVYFVLAPPIGHSLGGHAHTVDPDPVGEPHMARPNAPIECTKCGQTHRDHRGHPGCTGHISSGPRKGEPCTKSRRKGQEVCDSHGGRARQNVKAATRRQQEEAADNAVRTLGLPVDVSPTDALLEEVRWTAGHVQWLRARVQELEDGMTVAGYGADNAATRHPLVWGTTKVTEKQATDNPGTDTVESSGPSIWYDLYAKERAHLVVVCREAIKAGVEERRVRLAEQQGELVAGAIRAILADLGLTPEQQDRVSDVVPRHLRMLAGGAA